MEQATSVYHKREFWAKENLHYVKPHFRLTKTAGLINKVARGKSCDLLDVGCGPAALMQLLDQNVHYYGLDIAIQNPAPNLREMDFVECPIRFEDRCFDIIVTQGVFEYVGTVQQQKLLEIRDLLKDHGTFIVTYVNFDHLNKSIYWPYNNVQSFRSFHQSVARVFHVQRYFPTSHRWHHDEPRDVITWALQKRVNVNIPVLSRMFGVEYVFICAKK